MTIAPPAPAEPTTSTDPQQVDVTAVLLNIDAASALRDRIKAMQAEFDAHAGLIKDALGSATEGTDASGKVVVRFPHRSRHGLDKKAVQAMLSDEDYGKVSRITNYRQLLFGED